MLLKAFEFIFSGLVGKLPEEKKEKAWKEFKILLAILAESGAKGAAEGLTHG